MFPENKTGHDLSEIATGFLNLFGGIG